MQGIVSKRGGLLDENSIEIILAVAGIFLLFMVLFALFSPSYDEADKIAESYFEMLKEAVGLADFVGEGSFFMLDHGEKDLKFYLILFGDKAVAEVGDGGVVFKRSKKFIVDIGSEKGICVCYSREDKTSCEHCMDFDFPTDVDGSGSQIMASEGVIVVKKIGEGYRFEKK
jgi:hypothetical protein